MRPEALTTLTGSDFIIHAGDIGSQEVLDGLSRLAPVTAIRGNVDKGDWSMALPVTEVLACGETFIYVLHNLADLDLSPEAAGFQVVVAGHSHKPAIHEKNGVLYVNPGSAGPRRFSLPIAVGRLTIAGRRVSAELITLG